MAPEANTQLTLKVVEAQAKDVGRAIARIDPKDMERLGLEVGGCIEIEGKRKTVAKVMPAYPEDRGKSTIQIDGLIRENAKAGLDEKITIAKVAAKTAEKIVLSPLTLMRSARRGGDQYLGRLLEGLTAVTGDRIRATLFGTQNCEFSVVSTLPKEGPVIITTGTAIQLQAVEHAEGKRGLTISYEDIGGLRHQIRRIREMIELPLKYPEVFERLGIEPPKGVFLYGPPGCGKTLIAKAVANETDAYFTDISGPEIMGKFYGESEARLRKVFEDAQAHAPAILFIDEIDSIAPKREEMGGEKQVERRVVAQLLALMDGLESRGQVIVIAATNIPNVIDPALRRPGRFDREIAIPIPDRNSRLEILHIHTRGMPLAKDVELARLADITHGFVGADLAALCREAAMVTLRQLLPEVDFDLAEIPVEKLMKLEVTQEAFLEALREVEPSAIREVFVETPNITWGDVGGLDEIKKRLIEAVEWPLKHAELFAQARVRPPKGILLTGPPGCGKTLLAKALAAESELNFISIKGPELMSKYVGESERGVREIFRKAKQAAPAILFFDEIDSLVPQRSAGGGDSLVAERVISQFLTELDGIEELKGVLVLAATNRPDLVDPALLRPGRFDLVLELPMPDEQVREMIFRVHAKGKPLARDVDLKWLAKEAGEFTGAEVEAVCQEAAMRAIREAIERKADAKISLTMIHFRAALDYMKARKGPYAPFELFAESRRRARENQ
ncbi:MAG: CDC48 family AAA ATPase [Candidatus Acidiferrales bacterium]|jgi:transitional endoplasmic reticulum ATPase